MNSLIAGGAIGLAYLTAGCAPGVLDPPDPFGTTSTRAAGAGAPSSGELGPDESYLAVFMGSLPVRDTPTPELCNVVQELDYVYKCTPAKYAHSSQDSIAAGRAVFSICLHDGDGFKFAQAQPWKLAHEQRSNMIDSAVNVMNPVYKYAKVNDRPCRVEIDATADFLPHPEEDGRPEGMTPQEGFVWID